MKTELHEKEDCNKFNCHLCPNMEPLDHGFECPACGLSYKLNDDDLFYPETE